VMATGLIKDEGLIGYGCCFFFSLRDSLSPCCPSGLLSYPSGLLSREAGSWWLSVSG
jgi:hypothetical protein